MKSAFSWLISCPYRILACNIADSNGELVLGVSVLEREVNEHFQVSSMTELQPVMLRVNMTTNIGVNVPAGASQEELESAIELAHLSKDSGIGNLTWAHTTEALGAQAMTEDDVQTELMKPKKKGETPWKAIFLPIVAGALMTMQRAVLALKRYSIEQFILIS
jgi:hypothetical protein